jgi:D-inositol-3-phosphate glycosyltransferase
VRVALIGPTHPYKGGIAHHTTELAHRLAARGHDVRLESWSAQYPALLYPGQQKVTGPPELAPFPGTAYPLSWRRPDSWWRLGRRLRTSVDAVVLVLVTPVQSPAHLGILRGLDGGRADTRPRVLALTHNVLPHERRAIDERLVRAVLAKVDAVLVHSAAEAERAATLTEAPVTVAALPPHLPGGHVDVLAAGQRPVRRRLLFFGLVRPYKGLDVLLRALATGPDDVSLTVAGEFWGGTEATETLVRDLALTDRVTLRPGYVAAEDIAALFADADALVLPYRSGTASQNAYLAFEHGIPVVATRVGTLGETVRDGVDGLLADPDDVASLAAALRRLYEPGVLDGLRAGVRPVDADAPWASYVDAVEAALGARRSTR